MRLNNTCQLARGGRPQVQSPVAWERKLTTGMEAPTIALQHEGK